MVNIQDEINKLVELSYYLYEKEIQRICDEKITDDDYICKSQYKNVGFGLNNFVGKPTFLFSLFYSDSVKY